MCNACLEKGLCFITTPAELKFKGIAVQKSGFFTRKRVVLLLVLIGIVAAIYFGRGMLSGGAEKPPEFGVPVETATVKAQALDVTIDSVGTLAANESVILRPEVAGRITDIKFTEGQPVKKGDVLFQIDDRMAQAEMKQANANLQLARLNEARFAKLATTGAATKRTRDEARANLGVAQANFDLAKTKIDYAQIVAPFDGTVGLRKVSPGDYVNIGQELANFVSYDPMKVNFTIPETDTSRLAVGQQIGMTVEALPGETFRGTVFALDPQLDVNGRAVSLRATIPNPDNRLRPGMFARISLIVSRKEGALLIPENAIVPQGNDKMVYVVGADSTVTLVPVTLGERRAGEVEITQGLQEGDVVVTSGQIKLHPGAKVTDLAAMQQQTPAANLAPAKAAPADVAPAEQATEPAAEQPSTTEPTPSTEAVDPALTEPVAPSEEGMGEGAMQVPLTDDTNAAAAPAPAADGEETP